MLKPTLSESASFSTLAMLGLMTGAYRELARGAHFPEKLQKCHKYFLQYRTFAPERP